MIPVEDKQWFVIVALKVDVTLLRMALGLNLDTLLLNEGIMRRWTLTRPP